MIPWWTSWHARLESWRLKWKTWEGSRYIRLWYCSPELINRRLKNAMLRNKELEDAAQISLSISHVLTTGRVTWSPFFKKSFVWLWKLVPQTSRCYIIFHVLCYCARVLKPDSAVWDWSWKRGLEIDSYWNTQHPDQEIQTHFRLHFSQHHEQKISYEPLEMRCTRTNGKVLALTPFPWYVLIASVFGDKRNSSYIKTSCLCSPC